MHNRSTKRLFDGNVRRKPVPPAPKLTFSPAAGIHNALKIPHRLYRTTTADSTSTLGDEEEQSYPPRTVHEWDFAGWGTMSFAEVSEEEVRKAREEKEEERRKAGDGALGSW